MPLRTEDNMMDGLSVFVQSEEELSQVPLSHRSLIGTEERTALHDLATYFHRLAKKAKRIVLREWLTMLADCKDWILELHKPGMKGPRNDVLLRFYLENESSPAIRLLSGTSPTKLPRSLAEVYRLFNGTNHFGYGMAGGLWRVEDLSTFGRAGPWLSDENSLDPDACIPLFDTMS